MEAEQVAAILEVAGEDRALLATAIMAGGLRVSEVTGLRWGEINLASYRLSVVRSKTDAGRREVDLAPDLRDELVSHKASSASTGPNDFVFPTKRGTRRDRNTTRTRILYPAIDRTNALPTERGLPTIPDGSDARPRVTFHSLRRTYASLLAEAGADSGYTMSQIGHKSARLTLEVCTDAGNRRHPDR